jgi:dihydroorotate dehydrogenase electron transfer subunit
MYENYEIIEIMDEANNVKTFLLDNKIVAKPGQFVMVWLPGISEKPFSLSYDNGITVKKLGPFTEKLFDLHIGDKLFLRGPYGNSFLDFAKDSNKYLIAGGTGAAPLAFFAEWLDKKPTVLLGARTKDELVFENRLRRVADVLVSTDDGSCGIKGMVTELFNKISPSKNSQFFICGPEKMMFAAAKKALQYTQAINIILSLERIMKCGYGICGNCEIEGLRICVDGPVFSYETISRFNDFSRFKRDKTGKKVEI